MSSQFEPPGDETDRKVEEVKELVRTVMASKSLKRRTKLLEQATQLLREIGQLKGRELGLKTIEEQIRKLARTG